ncbi:tripartite tricarboxylate transporter substrate binding protein [Telmatospirillum sp. J64-1]|uniref:tripartite tricarboxylate transporter substrate binding protein n=1 Tax=Telmatospirillum sp. J64-1 TaxID=2502183 RepID=UPI0021054E3D|nr:tripartite tricarboxylate transporter substrate binding protein [Telmatospirillum sp. J64-1]
MRKKILALSAAVLSAAVFLPMQAAQAAWPERPITFIVPWSAGGGTDAVARMLGTLLEKELGQPINVVNRTGGSGVVGHQAIASARPDGYTIGMVTIEIAMMHWQGLTNLTYRDYTPLGLVNVDPAGVQVAENSQYKSGKDIIEAARANPGRIKASGTAQGGVWHLALAGMLQAADVDPMAIQWVPSQGAAPALQDLMAGGVDLVTVSLPEAKSVVDAGRVRNLLVMDDERNPDNPDVPSIKEELGVEFALGTWRGVAAPAELPQDIADKLSAALEKVHASQEFRDFMAQRGFTPVWMNGADYQAFMAKNDEELGNLMKAIGMAK